MNNTQKYLILLFEALPRFGYPKEWVGYSELLKYLTVEEIDEFTEKGYIESNHGEYDNAEPSYRLTAKNQRI